MFSLYAHRTSLLHRMKPGSKLCFFLLISACLWTLSHPLFLLALFILVGLLYPLARLSVKSALHHIRPLVIFLVPVMLVQLLMSSWSFAAAVALRCITLVLAASLLTLTTKIDDVLRVFATLLKKILPTSVVGKIMLALALALRWIPSLLTVAKQMKEAQQARGVKASGLSLALPLSLKVVYMGTTLADAVEARLPSALTDTQVKIRLLQ